MPSQLGAITPSYRRNQTAELRGRMEYLPQLVANQQRANDIQRESAQFNRSMSLQKKQMKEAQKQKRYQMGLEAGKLGIGLAGRYGGSILGNAGAGAALGFGVGSFLGSGLTSNLIGAGVGAALGAGSGTSSGSSFIKKIGDSIKGWF